jgi:hypothetical protein
MPHDQEELVSRTVRAGAALAALLLLTGCPKNEPASVGVSGDDLPAEGSVDLKVVLPDENGEPAETELTYKIELTSPLQLVMSASGYAVVEAGTDQPNSGHFHLLWTELDPDDDASKADSVCVPVGDTIETGDEVLHFGDAATEAELELEPGVYRLCLQLGDFEHTALDPRHEYTIVVVDGEDAGDGDGDGDATTTTEVTTTTEAPSTSEPTSTTAPVEGSSTTTTTTAPTTTTEG